MMHFDRTARVNVNAHPVMKVGGGEGCVVTLAREYCMTAMCTTSETYATIISTVGSNELLLLRSYILHIFPEITWKVMKTGRCNILMAEFSRLPAMLLSVS